MILKYYECRAGGNILADLGKYSKVSEYLEALLVEYKSEEPRNLECLPLDVFVRTPQKGYNIIKEGTITPEASKCIQELKKIPQQYNKLMSDTLLIKGDGFERELSFDLLAGNA